MPLKSGERHWGSLAKTFHWLVVLLIIVQGAVGLYMVGLPKKPSIIPYYNFHKSIGILILTLAVLRLVWRAFDARPAEPPSTPPWQALGARAGHALLYALLFAVPLSGWWFDSVTALRPMYFFGLFEVPHIAAPNVDLKELAHEAHEWLFWLLVIVACGHAAMAFIHEFVSRDGTLSRMLPGRAPVLASTPVVATSDPIPATTENDHVENPTPAADAAARPAGDDAPRGPGA
ncbi:MAG: cytochrome b [Rudaea sp.]|uniref:cytochrome b n=1 Tax=unclassified Rudaea TaxID=2627037 RepID=UPI0010F6D563|nr:MULTISPECIES: cytochrome b [unclassified Rudaea]MBN8888334.1 cytochrome b [Rudaea sp.]MBR0346878.1 cytochrome b [Rudaea sp.]